MGQVERERDRRAKVRGGEKGKIPARECEREWDEKGTGRRRWWWGKRLFLSL